MKLAHVLGALGLLVVCAMAPGSAQAENPGAGETFRDCPDCPEMVFVPAGEFMMGSPGGEGEVRFRDEGPLHHVSVRQPFAIGKYEVTFAEWDACVAGGGCNNYRPDDKGWGRGKRPVINVSHEDTKYYTAWLSLETGLAYRLPSESEWEYAARANTSSARYWGTRANQACSYANVADRSMKEKYSSWIIFECRDGYVHTSPVGKFRANAFGLHDMLGNLREWAEDCWTDGYAGAPSDTNVWTDGDCRQRVLRGGSWVSKPWTVRFAYRYRIDNYFRYLDIGFRVARPPGNAQAADPDVGETFRDCADCPEMIELPAGEFMMGSPEGKEGRWDEEGPVHLVSVRQPFAIGKYEVTFAEWDACVAGGGCNGYRPDDEGWGEAIGR